MVVAVYEKIQGIQTDRITLTQGQYRIAPVSPLTLCCIEIQAVTSCDGFSFLGLPFGICERTIAPIPGPVTDLTVSANTIGIQSFDISWSPPENFNTTPVMYDIRVNSEVVASLIEITYWHINNLNPCTMYDVSVTAYSSSSDPPFQSPPMSFQVATRPSLPPPPQNVMFSYVEMDLSITWSEPMDGTCDNYDIHMYRLYWSCNNITNERDVPSSSTSTIIDIPNGRFDQGWCIAQIQSCDRTMRCGNFSNQATVPLTRMAPSQPRCFIQSESSTNVSISFSISQPFVADSFEIVWMLDGRSMQDGSYTYNNLSSNLVNLRVETNTTYNFELRACNIYGCSPPCTMEFTTMVSQGGDYFWAFNIQYIAPR